MPKELQEAILEFLGEMFFDDSHQCEHPTDRRLGAIWLDQSHRDIFVRRGDFSSLNG